MINTPLYKAVNSILTKKSTLPALVISTLLLMLVGCQDNTAISSSIEGDLTGGSDEPLNVGYETIQVLTDLPPIVQQALGDAYFNEKNVRIEWLSVHDNADDSISNNSNTNLEAVPNNNSTVIPNELNIDLTATVDESILIKPSIPEIINSMTAMTAEEALLSGVPLPEVISEPVDIEGVDGEGIDEESIDEDSVDADSADAIANVSDNASGMLSSQTSATSTQAGDVTSASMISGDTSTNNTVANSTNAPVTEEEEDEDVVSMNERYLLPPQLDVLLLHSAYDIQKVANDNQLQPFASELITERVPEYYQDPNGRWVGLSMYGRSIAYNQQRVNEDEILNYAKLEDSKWYQRLCLTNVNLPDNQAILQMMQTYRGESDTREILAGWQRNLVGNRRVNIVNNMTTDNNDSSIISNDANNNSDVNNAQQSNASIDSIDSIDSIENEAQSSVLNQPYTTLSPLNTAQLQAFYYDDETKLLDAINSGHCDVGIVNSDSFMRYASTHPNTSVRLSWANQINHGTVTNVIATGIAKQSDDTAQALDFIEWLAQDQAQALLAFYSKTFPVVTITDPGINLNAVRPEWSKFDADTLPLSGRFATHNDTNINP